MAAIPPFVWILVGIMVVAVSVLIKELQFFAVLGALFILWGLLKLLWARWTRKPVHRPEHTYHTQTAPPPQGQLNCFVCGARNSATANYCGHCGHRLTKH